MEDLCTEDRDRLDREESNIGGNGRKRRLQGNILNRYRTLEIKVGVAVNNSPGSVKENVSVCSSLLVKINCNSCGMSESGSSGSTSGKLVLPIVPLNPNSTLVWDAIGILNNLLLSSDDLFLE